MNQKLKSDQLANKYRCEGNIFFHQRRFIDALLSYNKSLCYTHPGTEPAALCYANRSAAYLEVREFDHCLNNIQMAKDSGYPAEKLNKLNEREEKCKQLMKMHVPDPEDDPFNYFKLSYPAHEKIPFLAKCIEFRQNKQYGKHLVTTQDLKAGDIVAIYEPNLFRMLDQHAQFHQCGSCWKGNCLDLLPCTGCASSEFHPAPMNSRN